MRANLQYRIDIITELKITDYHPGFCPNRGFANRSGSGIEYN